MDIQNLIDKLNNELEKINKLRNEKIDTNSFFTNNVHFNDDISLDDINNPQDLSDDSIYTNTTSTNVNTIVYNDIEPDDETKAIVVKKESSLFVAQDLFKKSIKFSLKSFLISISLSFLNLFI